MSVAGVGSLIGPIIAGIIADHFNNKSLFLFSIPLTLIALFALTKVKETKENPQEINRTDFNPFSKIKDLFLDRKLKGMSLLGIVMNSKIQIFAIFFPILIVEQLGFSKTTLGLLLAIPSGIRIGQVFFGKIADSISPEFGVLLGVSIVSLTLFTLPYIQTLSSLIILIILYGIGISIWNVNAWSLIGRVGKKYAKNGEIISSYVALSKLGVGVSTLISGTLITFMGISEIIQIFAILTFTSAIISYFLFSPIFQHKKNISDFK